MTANKGRPNRLAGEKSPYLLQHAHNPVDWYPWGDEAFARARAEDKPIFLSVGYSTCHWCHVMERESFEASDVAEMMNARFINVKVDREERPDVDRVYMTYVQATTGQGGWPMSVWLTPELHPFYGGTYFPPRGQHGRPGFLELLAVLDGAWTDDREKIVSSSRQLVERLRGAVAADEGAALVDSSALFAGFKAFQGRFDKAHGGFGDAPKFPRPVAHNFLLRYFARTGDEEAARMVLTTLAKMADGGMYDQLGGGFHRYSVDGEWHVPHFEKMLYDQAQLAISYLEGYQVSGDARLAEVARGVCDYVLTELTDPATGAFYSAEDADSTPPGGGRKREGAFYVWTHDELAALLGDDASLFAARYGTTPEGNADDPHGELTGTNVLHVRETIEALAETFSRSPDDVEATLAAAAETLAATRTQRPRPHLDDKVITAWNGMMIGAFARASRVLKEPRYLVAAQRAATFVRATLYADRPTLMRRFRDGETAVEAYLDDYAQLVQGLLELYQADFDVGWLQWAEALTDHQIEAFGDDAGGFFCTTGEDPSVLLRMKDDYDGAEPSANAIAAGNLLLLGHLLDRADWIERATATIRTVAERVQRMPEAVPQMLVAVDLLLNAPAQAVIAADADDADCAALRDMLDAVLPRGLLVVRADAAFKAAYGERLPFVMPMGSLDGNAAVYVCHDRVCERPTSDAAVLKGLVGGSRVERDAADQSRLIG